MSSQRARNQYDSVFPAVNDVTSPEQHNLAVLYGTSSASQYRALAFQITRSMRRIERLPTPITVPAGGTVPFGILTSDGHATQADTGGTDIFHIGTARDSTIEEYGFGIEVDGVDASDVYIGIEPHGGNPIMGVQGDDDDRARGFSADSLDVRGGVSADLTLTQASQYATTALSENPDRQGTLRIDSRQDGRNNFRFGFKNTGTADATVTVHGMGSAYRVRQVTDREAVRDMVTPGGIASRPVTYGSFSNDRPNLPRSWTDHIVTVDANELVPPF